MAFPKRESPLTDEERRERNRRYQQTRRERTNNGYARAYRRAAQRAVAWFQENQPELWNQWLNDEQQVVESRGYSPLQQCSHDSVHAIGVTAACDVCHQVVGNISIDEDQRATASEWIA